MKGIKKEPTPAKGLTRIDNKEKIINSLIPTNSINRDAKVLQLLKAECNKRGAGHATLIEVFRGLLSVHNRNLISFSEALKKVD